MVALHLIEELFAYGGTPRKMLSLVRHASGAAHHIFVCFRSGSLAEEVAAAGAEVHVLGTTDPMRIVGRLRDIDTRAARPVGAYAPSPS